jgi:FkbM family methyltransferase
MSQFRRFVQEMFQRMGWEVRRNAYPNSEEVLLGRFLKIARPDTIFDIGANIGQYASMLRRCGYTGRIVSFEALPAVHAELTTAAARDVNWNIAPCVALGRAPGEAEIHVAGNSLSSSLLPMHDAHVRAAPESRYVAVQKVRVARLDELAPTLSPEKGRLLLKIDTQGYEEEVLMGAGAVLDDVCAMQLELSVVQLYEGAPTLRRMLDLCEQCGFDLYGLMPGFYEQSSGRLLQIDGLFLRAVKV